MKILVAPMNWGLGHASRCVPLVQRLLNEGHEVILGGDGESLTLLRKHFPKLRYTYLAPLNLRYSKGQRQVWAMIKAMPRLLKWSIQDHLMLKALLREEHIDQVISDNRFGLYNKQTECVYMTHQLHIMLPRGWRWAEGIASRMHARVYARYNKVWVPDYEDPQQSLAGELSHPQNVQCTMYNVQYIGPLSRFQNTPINQNTPIYSIIAVLSGLEPHRTLLENEIIVRYRDSAEQVLIVQGLMHRPNTRIKRGNLTIVPSMEDTELAAVLIGAKHIIARSGYSTIMDLEALGLMDKAELIATPGQPEQEYLATLHNKMQ
jgi:UDP:flavonoid glycosyltransferase YjiC (YdhE family)